MGKILSIFKKIPDSPSTQLEAINKEITEIEGLRRQKLHLQKKLVASLVIYSILIYLVAAIIFFVYYYPQLKLVDRLLYSLPLLLFPVLVLVVKRFLNWYYVKRIAQSDLKLADLKEQKNKIIEDVMENETYKKATEILQKYAPSRLRHLSESREGAELLSPQTPQLNQSTELRQRNVPQTAQKLPVGVIPPTPFPSNGGVLASNVSTPLTVNKVTMQQRTMYGGPPGPPLPRQVLPRERSYMDKLFEHLVGDGPQNRYALICKYCCSHNGMAIPEEFEYLSFRCCYCFNMNEARKLRPNAPRLNLDTTVDSEDEEVEEVIGSEEDTDDDVEEIQNDPGQGRGDMDVQLNDSSPPEDKKSQ